MNTLFRQLRRAWKARHDPVELYDLAYDALQDSSRWDEAVVAGAVLVSIRESLGLDRTDEDEERLYLPQDGIRIAYEAMTGKVDLAMSRAGCMGSPLCRLCLLVVIAEASLASGDEEGIERALEKAVQEAQERLSKDDVEPGPRLELLEELLPVLASEGHAETAERLAGAIGLDPTVLQQPPKQRELPPLAACLTELADLREAVNQGHPSSFEQERRIADDLCEHEYAQRDAWAFLLLRMTPPSWAAHYLVRIACYAPWWLVRSLRYYAERLSLHVTLRTALYASGLAALIDRGAYQRCPRILTALMRDCVDSDRVHSAVIRPLMRCALAIRRTSQSAADRIFHAVTSIVGDDGFMGSYRLVLLWEAVAEIVLGQPDVLLLPWIDGFTAAAEDIRRTSNVIGPRYGLLPTTLVAVKAYHAGFEGPGAAGADLVRRAEDAGDLLDSLFYVLGRALDIPDLRDRVSAYLLDVWEALEPSLTGAFLPREKPKDPLGMASGILDRVREIEGGEEETAERPPAVSCSRTALAQVLVVFGNWVGQETRPLWDRLLGDVGNDDWDTKSLLTSLASVQPERARNLFRQWAGERDRSKGPPRYGLLEIAEADLLGATELRDLLEDALGKLSTGLRQAEAKRAKQDGSAWSEWSDQREHERYERSVARFTQVLESIDQAEEFWALYEKHDRPAAFVSLATGGQSPENVSLFRNSSFMSRFEDEQLVGPFLEFLAKWPDLGAPDRRVRIGTAIASWLARRSAHSPMISALWSSGRRAPSPAAFPWSSDTAAGECLLEIARQAGKTESARTLREVLLAGSHQTGEVDEVVAAGIEAVRSAADAKDHLSDAVTNALVLFVAEYLKCLATDEAQRAFRRLGNFLRSIEEAFPSEETS